MKVGDRVIVNGLVDDNLEIENQKGIVAGFTKDVEDILIDFDEKFSDRLYNGWENCEEKVNIKNGWFCVRKYITIIEEEKMTEIIAGINNTYEAGENRVNWVYGYDYKENNNSSQIEIRRNEKVLTFVIIGESFNSIERANKILAVYNCIIVEKPQLIKIKMEGQTIEVSVDKAKELGFNL